MTTYKKPNIKKMQAQCDAFNAICPVGGKVSVKLDGVDKPLETVTSSKAQILSGHSAVVWMENVSGCYLLDCVTPKAGALSAGQTLSRATATTNASTDHNDLCSSNWKSANGACNCGLSRATGA